MPRASTPEIIEKATTNTLSIRRTVKVSELSKTINEGFATLSEYIKEINVFPCDMPFVAYHSMSIDSFEIEIGAPFLNTMPPKGDIKAGVIPASKWVFCMHLGSYKDISDTHEYLGLWIGENGYKYLGTAYELYFNGPDFPESQMISSVMMPISD